VRLVHLRDSLFLAGYRSNELELIDLSTDPPTLVDGMQLEIEEGGGIMDFDFHRDETQIVAGFRGDIGAIINLRTKTMNMFDHRLPHPLIMV
jgi:hypothetical protein